MAEALAVAVFAAGLSVLGAVLCAAEKVGVRVGWLTDDPVRERREHEERERGRDA